MSMIRDNEDPITEIIDGHTLLGGVRLEFYYFDDDWKPAMKSKATQARIHEVDADGNIMASYWFIFRKSIGNFHSSHSHSVSALSTCYPL